MPQKSPTKSKQSRIRISDEMRQCVEIMATEGLPVPAAAERAGIARDTAVRNMRKPHVLALFNRRIREVRDNAAQAAYMRIHHQSITSESERIRFEANRWVAGIDGITPVQKVQGQHHHGHTFAGFEYPTLKAERPTPEDD